MRVRSVNVGQPEVREHGGRRTTTAFAKLPVDGPVVLRARGLEGDAQVYEGHGGPDMAALIYAHEHYAYWELFLGRVPAPAVLGENLTVEGLTEETACIGDVYRIGGATVQVSQPRVPCYKIGIVHRRPDMLRQVAETGYTGFFVRVLEEGPVAAGDRVELLRRPDGAPTVALLNRIRHHTPDDRAAIGRLLAAEGLSPAWRAWLQERLDP